ncbi:MAG: ROK family protein [Patescibacteria group bacterium]
MPILGIDIGASKIHYVIWEQDAPLISEEFKLSAPAGQSPLGGARREELIKITQDIAQKIKGRGVSAAGVGVPGTVEDGTLRSAPNFPELLSGDLKAELEKILGVPVTLVNDAKAFILAETALGAAKEFKNVVGLTLGSGLGGGLYFNGALYLGKGSAGEIGHEILDLPNLKETEDFVSAKFFQKFGSDPNTLRQQAEAGDSFAQSAFQEFGKNIGVVIANLVNLLDPEAIVLGGGIAGAYDFFIEEAKKTAAELIINPSSQSVPILRSALGAAAGAAGAAIAASR